MEKVKLLIFDLWMVLYFETLKNNIPIYVEGKNLSQNQEKFIKNEIFKFLIIAADPKSLPLRSGKAFHIGWKNCRITYKDIANRLTKQLIEEGIKLKKPLKENNIKGYIHEVKETITERVRKASEEFDWDEKLEEIE